MPDKYRPSNGTEGEIFQEQFCYRCLHDKEWREKEKNPCEILCLTMGLGIDDLGYPKEWTYDEDGEPVCTSFRMEGEQS